MPEMIFIFLLALILFGPKKLPEIGREIGKFMAEFKRASNDFKYQLQSEIENAAADVPPVSNPASQSSPMQQSSSFTQSLLPPAVSSVVSEIDNAHDRLMQTARMAFEAQNFSLRPPDTPVVAAAYPETASTAPAETPAATPAPSAPAGAEAAPTLASPVEASTGQSPLPPVPAKSESASQNG